MRLKGESYCAIIICAKRRIKTTPEIIQTRKSGELVIGKSQGRVNAHSSNKLSDYIDLIKKP